jgi:RNA polymerase sigma-70 factor (ECF subfamily)
VARGDGEAFSRLYDQLAPEVFGLVRRVLRNPAQAEEVTQEVLVEIWRTAPRFDPARGTATTWALTIAHRRAVDRIRSEEASRSRVERAARRELPATEAVSETVVDRLERARVADALAALTQLQRQSIELAYYGGHTHTEVAAILDVPLGTVKTRIRDGLIRLRDALGEGEPSGSGALL